MGQVLASIQDKFHGKQWKERQIRKISDKVFDRIKDDLGERNLAFEDLYIAVLIIYNDINKHLPGPHNDPPSKEKLKYIMQVWIRVNEGFICSVSFSCLGVFAADSSAVFLSFFFFSPELGILERV
ncbi:uncharacterized protein LOC110106518 [Dendrobium catenatum]|uniref:Uncharacterized protein n=1 Tax=Dendrobium catenatum TaxID=906689 RepID=A0A2I0VGF2_9ASPA|nr:uncharacterized protein LOC110106518 [Dendrobium catenatum]PKU62498.1 hypothetical protein MA16_Dca027706 [Dendrobium catenatum]